MRIFFVCFLNNEPWQFPLSRYFAFFWWQALLENRSCYLTALTSLSTAEICFSSKEKLKYDIYNSHEGCRKASIKCLWLHSDDKKSNESLVGDSLLLLALSAASFKFKQHCPLLWKIVQRAKNCLYSYSLMDIKPW